MDILKNVLFEKSIVTGLGMNIALGLGLLILGPAAAAIAGNILRPVAKSVIKGGIVAYNQGRSFLAEARETGKDVVSESKVEFSKEKEQPAAAHGKGEGPADRATEYGKTAVSEEGSTALESQPERTKPWIVRGY